MTPRSAPKIAIACGGTGGHLFPGLAVAEQLVRRGCQVTLLISPKEVDQQAVKNALERRPPARLDSSQAQQRAGSETGAPMEVVTLPAVGLSRGRVMAFASGFIKSYRAARNHFRDRPPQAALAMGGFTSAPPVLAAKNLGAQTFLHESNTIPGRANRWLSRVVDQAFVGFPQAASRLHTRHVTTTGTPVRPEFQTREAAACRAALGLDPARPVLLVMGGSQGATGINNLVLHALPLFWSAGVPAAADLKQRDAGKLESRGQAGSAAAETAALHPGELQFFHLTGMGDVERVRRAYAEKNLRALVHPFFAEMHLALGAATVAVGRAGASSLAELAAMRVPCVLIPFPAATDNHQFFNARAFEETGAARLLEQKNAAPASLANLVSELMTSGSAREKMQAALAKWHVPDAAEQIAEMILRTVGEPVLKSSKFQAPSSSEPSSSKHQMAMRTGGFGVWILALFWRLDVGAWNFTLP